LSDHEIGIVELAIELPGTIDFCIRLGDFLIGRLDAYRTAAMRIADYYAKLTVCCEGQKGALGSVRMVYKHREEDLKEIFVVLLQRLRGILFKDVEVLSKYTSAQSKGPAIMIRKPRFTIQEEQVSDGYIC
jgi:hypothetical protein